MSRLLGLLPPLLLLSALPAAAPPAETARPSPEVARLIAALGDDDEDARFAAAKKLEALGEAALPALRRAARKAADPDVRLRAAVVAAAIEKKTSGEIFSFRGHTTWATRVAVLPGGKRAVTSGDFLRLWDLETGKEVHHFAPDGYPWALSLSRDGKRVLVSRNDRSVRLYNIETGKEIQKFVGHTGDVWLAVLSADGKSAITGAFDMTIRVWDVQTGRQLRAFPKVPDYPRCGALSPDGKKLAVGHFRAQGGFETSPGTLRVWDVETGKELAAGTGHAGAITAASWSPDGKRVATSSFDKTLRVWEAGTGKELARIVASSQGCDAVAFLPDGKRLISTGWGTDHSVRLWRIDTGKELVRYIGHAGGGLCVAVTPDGKKAIVGDTAGGVRLWRVPPLKE